MTRKSARLFTVNIRLRVKRRSIAHSRIQWRNVSLDFLFFFLSFCFRDISALLSSLPPPLFFFLLSPRLVPWRACCAVIDSGIAVKSYFSGSAFVIAPGWPHPERERPRLVSLSLSLGSPFLFGVAPSARRVAARPNGRRARFYHRETPRRISRLGSSGAREDSEARACETERSPNDRGQRWSIGSAVLGDLS